MKYRVLWLPTAEDELADIWLRATNHAAITEAAQSIDRRLAAGGPDEGESRTDALRILFASPLAATFEMGEDNLEVFVVHVWRFRVS